MKMCMSWCEQNLMDQNARWNSEILITRQGNIGFIDYLQICCHVTDKYNKVINILTYNFSKEQCTLPEDDLRIETCRSILSVLV